MTFFEEWLFSHFEFHYAPVGCPLAGYSAVSYTRNPFECVIVTSPSGACGLTAHLLHEHRRLEAPVRAGGC
jgi:hypothetical protein